ncbi:Cytochrome P450 18a1 like protein [Argiope bruennichi]|uniref:Cytochrome P450 18a1 like protein n=1 Tax=Argiope bruennichi TaxID=94029 RepID=A0A8T0F8X6_ARGBR|nr:Cytochrome P450 18a1 like protein [Argiope bruennichi]
MDLEAIYKFFIPGDISFTTGGLLLAIVCCSLFMLIHGIAKWYGLHKNSPPGPAGLPIVGYLPFMGKEPHKTFWNLRKKYGDVISVYMGPKYTVILNDYNSVKEILCNPAALDRAPDLFSHLGDIGFISENGEKWIEQRRYCLSISRDLGLGRDHWEELIMEETTNFIKNIQDLEGKPTDISHILASSVTSNIISLLIGRRLTKDEVDIVQLSIDYSDVAFTYMGPSNPTSVVPGLRKVCEVFKIAGYDKAMKVIRQFSSFIRTNQDIHINGYVIPKGSEIIANLWALHHDPAYWDEPEQFRPERFLTDGGTKLAKNSPSYAPFSIGNEPHKTLWNLRNKYGNIIRGEIKRHKTSELFRDIPDFINSYLQKLSEMTKIKSKDHAFSGRRNCPGETIAWMEILYYFAEILKRFEISTPPAVEPKFEKILQWYDFSRKRPPGPTGLPFVGYLPFLSNEPHKKFWKMRDKYGDVIGVNVGYKFLVVLNEYKVMKEVLCHPATLNRAPDLFRHLGHSGFISENGEKWVEQRRYSMSVARDLGLGRGHWQDLIKIETDNFLKKLRQLHGKPADISHELAVSLTSNIISLLIGRRLSEDEADKLQLCVNFSDIALMYISPTNPTTIVPALRKLCEVCKIAGYDKAMKIIRHFSSFISAFEDISVNGCIIPKGSEITANLWALHHDPAYWDDPDEFRPERFLTDGGTKIVKNPPSYVPFSIGRRNCPGETIAWMEILFYFSEVVKNFEISTTPDVKPEFKIVNGLVSRLAPQALCFKERKS